MKTIDFTHGYVNSNNKCVYSIVNLLFHSKLPKIIFFLDLGVHKHSRILFLPLQRDTVNSEFLRCFYYCKICDGLSFAN